jgi:O-succinylhomoserine sulfhydrylase
MSLASWLDPASCPAERPPLSEKSAALHDAVDAHIRRAGVPYLHPESPTLQLDMLGSDAVVRWQEGKASFLFMGEGCWSELPHLYGRYGTTAGGELIARLRKLEDVPAVVLADCGMQATALTFDAVVTPGAHAICMRQVYNKSRTYLEWVTGRVGGSVTIVDDGDLAALDAAIRKDTVLVFAETFTNPLLRAQDPEALGALVHAAKKRAPALRLVLDHTIATPWALAKPLTSYPGIDAVVASGTKALGGEDRDMWGYVATRDVDLANQVMDLVALRGGNLDWRRATTIAAGLENAERAHAARSESATAVAAFLASHPRVEAVFHPSLPDHPDRAAIAAHYVRHGSLLSFRVKDADEPAARHVADALATTRVVRYALSFDGLTTKVNHHKSVSEYFTPPERLDQAGIARLIRLAVGTEDPRDIIAALNWALHHSASLSADDLAAWQRERRAALGLGN